MKIRRMTAILLSAMLCLAFALPAMGEGEIRIGFIGPLTGGAAVYGNSALHGAEIAVEEINALGGIQIALNGQDDEHDAEKSVNAYNALWDWNAQMIIGCVTSTPCVAVASDAFNDRMFMLTPSASSLDVISGNDNVFQVCFTDPAQGVLSAQFISEKKLAQKVAIIYNNADTYSTGIYQAFVEEAKDKFDIVSVTTFTDDTTDFTVQVSAAKDAGADLVYLPIYYTPASMILKTADSMGYDCLFFGVDGMDGILTMEGFDPAQAEGVMLLTPFSADAPDERTQKFVSTYKEKYVDIPSQFAADGYDCVYTLYQAIKDAGITADMSAEDCCETLIKTIQTLSVDGITGVMSWTEEGLVTKLPFVYKIVDGKYVEM